MKQQIPTLEGITRIVINRIAVWHLFETHHDGHETEIFWRKVKGGPGFDITPRKSTMKNLDEMQSIITSRLNRRQQIPLFKNQDLILLMEEPAYRWWKSGETLNIVTKDSPRPASREMARRIRPVTPAIFRKSTQEEGTHPFGKIFAILPETHGMPGLTTFVNDRGDLCFTSKEILFSTSVDAIPEEYAPLKRLLKSRGLNISPRTCPP